MGYTGIELEDTREAHRSNPATLWFIAKTSAGRVLKVVYVPRPDVKTAFLRTSYDVNPNEIRVYLQNGGVI